MKDRSDPSAAAPYVVGGIRLPRPFKIRRLGHFGVNALDPEASRRFYEDMLGLRVSDPIDMSFLLPAEMSAEARAKLGPSTGYFMRMGSDHHSFVLFPRRLFSAGRIPAPGAEQVTTNQITWQVGTLREVVDAIDFFRAQGVQVRRTGRDLPGSNWHVYPFDPDHHLNELYYGIEQIGWDGFSKPRAMHQVHYTEAPTLPHRSEHAEVGAGYREGVDPRAGFRHQDPRPEVFDVGGVLLARPFKIVRVGPVRLFVKDVEVATVFYRDTLGLAVTEEVVWKGHRCTFLRANTEHHSIALYPIGLRAELGLSAHTSLFSFGFQVGDYQQLRAAIGSLQAEGVTVKYLPAELFPGIDYCAFAIDPDGHAMQLYYYMEQVGWDGRHRPRTQEGVSELESWPETLPAKSDSFGGEVFLGPLA